MSTNGTRQTNGFEPPPSSMLATHVRQSNGIPRLNQYNFGQLLEESLGYDEDGNSNLDDNVVVNHKLMLVIIQVGLDPVLVDDKSNPFRSDHTSGRIVCQLGQCLDVLRLTITRTPSVLFQWYDVDADSDSSAPLYLYLIPKLLSVLGRLQNVEITKGTNEVISSIIGTADDNGPVLCQTLITFLQHCAIGLTNAAIRQGQLLVRDEVTVIEDDFSAYENSTSESISFYKYFELRSPVELLHAAVQLVSCLTRMRLSKQNHISIKKQKAKLQILLDDLHQKGETNAMIQACEADLKILHLNPPNGNSDFTKNAHEDIWPEGGRAHKRIRLSTEFDEGVQKPSTTAQLCVKLTERLTGRGVPNLDGLSLTVAAGFEALPEDDQCDVLHTLGIAACQFHIMTTATVEECPVCDAIFPTSRPEADTQHAAELMKTLLALRRVVQRRSNIRFHGLSAMRRILSHITSPEYLRLKGSAAGDWCLQSLRTSSRDMKFMAARALRSFVERRPGGQTALIHENRVVALEYLQAMWAEADPSSQEAVIFALTQMAQVVDDEELNIILLRLVDYLGHSNPYIAGLVNSELQQLGQYLQVNMAGLFRPYWRTLSVIVVRNFNKQPGLVRHLGELLGVEPDGVLQIIEEHALPYLVLGREAKLIERIGASSSSPMTTFDICTKENNLPRILALLFAQSYPDPEQAIMALLLNVSEDFREQDLAGWITLVPTQIPCEMLKMAGDIGQAKASKVYQGLQYFTQLITKRSSHSSASRRSDSTASFLQNHALAMVTQYTVKINETTPDLEKRRCLVALGEFVRLGKSRVKVALPQICACLRAAMDDVALCNAAFDAWATMVLNLGEDELLDLISQTFAVIVRAWHTLNPGMQEKAHNLISTLFMQHDTLLKEISSDLPSLASIPTLDKFENEIAALKHRKDERSQIAAFVGRLQDENATVVEQALYELVPLLRQKHDFIQKSILRDQCEPFVKDLARAILNACTTFESIPSLISLGAQCLGAIGCLDSSKAESTRERKRFVFTTNFVKAEETTAFLMFFMEQVLVKEYVSTSNLREKGFLAWSLQQLLYVCDLPIDITTKGKSTGIGTKDKHWFELSETTRLVLTPFLTSRYISPGRRQRSKVTYPFFQPGMTYKHWLTEVTLDFLNRGSGENVDMIFDVCCRLVVWGHGTSIASFLLPYAVLNILLTGIEKDKVDLVEEITTVLKQSLSGLDLEKQDHIRQCSQSVFDVLDYMSLWLQEARKAVSLSKARAERGIKDPFLERDMERIELVAPILATISPQIITQRAIECKSYARALFHQEQYISSQKESSDADYRRLQDIYAQIDEPDGIEGISAQIKLLDVESEVMEHKKAGRWNTAQSWYEMQLMDHPNDVDVQVNLLKCLKESGQHDVLIHHFDGIASKQNVVNSNLVPFAVEAAWVTNRWDKMNEYLKNAPKGDFAVSLGSIMLSLRNDSKESVQKRIENMFNIVAAELTPNSTRSFQSCHETMLKMHVLDDVRIMIETTPEDRYSALDNLGKRLSVIGSYVTDKQYLLGIQRAVMNLKSEIFKSDDIASSWLVSAKLARKAQAINQAFNAVLRASTLGDQSAAIEQAKLMWQEGHHRKAIHTLQGAIDSGAFTAHAYRADTESVTVDAAAEERNDMTARAYVLLGKWLDQAGQTQSDTIIKTFRRSTEQNRRWEKGWYNLGRHYNRILESEKLKPPGRESQTYLTGETAKLVIDNFLRALATGHKYIFQALPKVMTLWLELVGSNIELDPRRGNTQFHTHNTNQRKKVVEETNNSFKRYLERIPIYAIYTILPQLVARICHPDQNVNTILQTMIVKVLKAHPQQALWTVLATAKSSNKDRALRGLNLINRSIENVKKETRLFSLSEMRQFTLAGQKFADELLRIADHDIQGRVSKISLARDLGFNHKIAPSKLVVPCEACLMPNIPASNESGSTKTFRPFPKEPVTISAFLDDARVLPSLQKPRKLSLRGSDGQIYSVLAKPHDDLRKDQRLLEFDTMINRFLKHDINASKRRLYIRTYAVVPLNEECGLIEWVDGLKTMRDIILDLYRQRGIQADYAAVRQQLDAICARSEDKAKDYIEKVQSKFPPILRQWFVETFPDPTAWFDARLRYTRSSAVMSMVGHVLGLGDRHGENILLEEGNGGVLHVDFNCLFDKGLTFEKPEMVPFRLTHNMIDAFGPYKVDGPFRRCCEITLQLLRNNEDALMTILETFLHDPTTDFMTAGKKRTKSAAAYVAGEVPDTPERMLEGVKGKVRGMLAGESVPLSVGGYVEEMIRRAKDEANLARMYIGWCAFL